MKWRRHEGLPHQTLDGETLIVVPKRRRTHHLNPTASFLWALLEEPRSFEELAARMEEEFDAPAARIRADLRRILRELERRELAERVP